MNSEYMGRLARQFGFDQWSQRQGAQDEGLFVWRFAPAGTELSGWRMHRAERSAPAAARAGTAAAAGDGAATDAPGTHSLWVEGKEGGGSMLRVDTYECASRADARTRLLALLGQHQGAAIFQESRDAAGEVAFTAPGGHAQLFARGNLVVQVRNASRQLVAVDAPARELDALLRARPEPAEAEALGMRAGDLAPDDLPALGRRIQAEADEPGQPPVWFKFFATGGEVVLEGGVPVFRPTAGATPAAGPRITTYVVGVPRARPGTDRTFGIGG